MNGEANRTYDPQRGWMTNLSVQTQGSSSYLVNQSYAYYANGQVETATDAVSPALTANYSYDYLNRLTAASTSSWGLAWTYDPFGNRTAQTATAGSPPSSSLSYDTTNYTNRIVTDGNNGTYTYDANGNLTQFPGPQGATSVTYDAFDRAVSFTVASSTSTVSYDAFGRRIAKTFSGGLQRLYFYDPSGRLLAEYDNPSSGNNPSRTTQYFAGQRVGQWTDRVGSKRADSGSSSQYYPYGEEITSTNNDTYKFAGTYRDSDSGLDYVTSRYYASSIGRFLTVDGGGVSYRKPQMWNRYAYAANNPTNLVDPTGDFPCVPGITCAPDDPDPGDPGEGGGGGCVSAESMSPQYLPVCPPGGGGGGPTLNKTALVQAADNLMNQSQCATFVFTALEGGYLAENDVTSVDQLAAYQQSLFYALGRGAVASALTGATFDSGGASPTNTVNGKTYTTIAQTSGSALGGGATITFFSAFFGENSTAKAQTVLHEGMHAVSGISDINFAMALGVYTAGMTQSQASAAWDAKLQANCP